uniref:Uncharacterized protein n=1 Tax=Caenorhabditis japonica TaxID=281687 RepID=A0A8R1HW68_CAEJA
MINQRIQKCKDKPDVLDDELVKYMMAVLMTEANEMEKELKFHHLRLKRFEVLLEEKLEKVFPEMLKTFPKTLPIIRSVASEKFISWWERGISDQEDIEKRVVLSVELELAITPTDKQKMMEIQRKMFKFLDKCAPRTVLKSKSCADLQLPLFVEILRCRLSAQNERALRAYLAITILGVDPQSVGTIEKEANYAESVRDAIKELVKMVKRKQREEMPSFIPELPRTEALIESLQMITEFAFLTLSPNMRGIVNGMVTSVLERCQRYETRLKEFTIGQEEKERDRWDVQFILDTLLRHLSKSEMQTAYIENFKKIITRAADLFPCETKYMRKFTEVHSGSTLKNMQLGIILTNRNKKIMESRLERFDLELERKQMMNSLSTMFSSMRLSASIGKSSNQRSVYNKYLEEARNLHDPAVWRLAIKAAARVGTSCLEKDAYIRAIGQCPWSLNIHLDYIEGMGPSSQDGQQTVLGKTMCYLLEIGDSMPHITFVEEEETLDTYLEVAMKAPRVE